MKLTMKQKIDLKVFFWNKDIPNDVEKLVDLICEGLKEVDKK